MHAYIYTGFVITRYKLHYITTKIRHASPDHNQEENPTELHQSVAWLVGFVVWMVYKNNK
jgi:hypothetical protein